MPVSPTLPVPAAALGRRTVLAAGLGLGLTTALAGCSDDGSSTGTGGAHAPVPSLAPDVAVATTALDQIRAVREAVEATVQRFPALRADLLGVSAMHTTHESSLADAVPKRATTTTTPTPYVVPVRRPVALQRLAQSEQRLHDSLGGLALRAESGDFARLLSCMGAGISQRLAAWPA